MKPFAWFTSCALLLLAAPLFAQPSRIEAGPATPLTSSPAYASEAGEQRIGTAVPTDGGWIAVWSSEVMSGNTLPYRVLSATRLARDGSVRDPIGIRLSSDVTYRGFTAVPHAGGARVFWGAGRLGKFRLHTATVSDEGEVIDALDLGEYPSEAEFTALSAAVSGTRTALLSHRYVMILDGTRLLRTVDLGGFGDPSSIVAVGSHFVASWLASGGILMRQTLDLDGNVVGTAGGTGVAQPCSTHELATNGTNALFVWNDGACVRLGLLDPATGQFVEKGVVAPESAAPQAVWDGSSYVVAWFSPLAGALLGVHVSSEGDILDAAPLTLFERYPEYFALVARGEALMLLREIGGCPYPRCDTDVVSTPLGSAPAEDHLLSIAARFQLYPAVASDGRGFLAIWEEFGRILATETGERSRTPTTPIDLDEAYADHAVVTSNGSGYLAAWVGQSDGLNVVKGKVLIPTDDALTVRPFSYGTSSFLFGVSAGAAPGVYLVTWSTGSGNEAMRVTPDGTLLDAPPFKLFDDTYLWTAPSIAFDGIDFIVAWSSYDSSTGPLYRLRTARVGLDGSVRFDRLWMPSASGSVQELSLACGGDTCLLVWREETSDAVSPWRVAGQRFRQGGALIDPVPFDIEAADAAQITPSVAWDGRRFVVSWRTYDADLMAESVEVRLIPASGEVEPRTPDLVVSRNSVAAAPVTACNLEGHCVIVEPRFVDDPTLGRTTRLFKRFFGEARHRAVRR